jgi:hypothetical protein
VAFIVAHSTASLHPEGYDAGFAAERAWQLERLVEPLGLAVSATSAERYAARIAALLSA